MQVELPFGQHERSHENSVNISKIAGEMVSGEKRRKSRDGVTNLISPFVNIIFHFQEEGIAYL
jgi:hypothetical protein